MNACIDAILKPAGISVEVAYLDRSAGEEMNTFHWQGDLLEGRAALPTVRLLYRPYVRRDGGNLVRMG
jgi:ubiquitin thioesterase protein OTUB1